MKKENVKKRRGSGSSFQAGSTTRRKGLPQIEKEKVKELTAIEFRKLALDVDKSKWLKAIDDIEKADTEGKLTEKKLLEILRKYTKKHTFRCMLCDKVREYSKGKMVYYDKKTDVMICEVHK